MITDERLEYFLNNENITDDEYDELVKGYFQADKTNWYTQENGKKKWLWFKNLDFWKLIRLYSMPRGRENKFFNFNGFVFLEFQHTFSIDSPFNIVVNNTSNFWEADMERSFDGDVNFDYAHFLSEASFISISFLGAIHFRNAIFMDRALFKNISFANGLQMQTQKGIDIIMEDMPDPNSIDFHWINFSDNTVLKRVNLINASFWRTDLAKITFKECDWGNKYRIILKDEGLNLKLSGEYKGLEELYRQLKKSYDLNKDWELSGKAYISEMEMRKKRLWKQKDYYHWLIYWFYGFFGGYTQNIKKPILSIISLILVFSILYLKIDNDPLNAIQRGLKGALPYLSIDIDKDEQFKGYWLIARNVEFILGSTFLSFFILALRKRFKQ